MAGVNAGMESMSNRVYPTHSSTQDTDTWTRNTGGGRMSKSPTSETYAKVQNNLTMEEVRWSEMRKKIPGMGRVPRTKFYHEEDGFERARQENNFFIRTHFKQKECFRFVPAKKGQLPEVKKVQDMRCECGEILLRHHGMQGPTPNSHADRDMVESYLVPDELKSYVTVAKGNNDMPNMKDLPSVSWNADTAIRSSATTAFGKISFVNVDAMGGQKPAKYVRLAPEDSIDHLIELMDVHWKINEPKRPNLVISVVGGAKNCKLDGHIREKFSTGLIKAAKTTDAWLITSGFNMGVMKYVGMAVKDGQSFTWNNDRMAHVLRCIGIAPWGYVSHRHKLESPDSRGLYNAEYKTSNIILHGQPVPLNANHTHFIFVDDGFRNRYGGVAAFRAQFENRVQQTREEGGLGIPVVLVVVEGGTDAIDDAKNSLQQNIPVVVCAGTGRAADILSYAYQHYTGKLTKEHKLRRKIQEAYGTKWSEEEKEAKTEPILEKIKLCLKKKDLMVNFSMNKNEDLDLAILSCLLKAKSGEATEKERLNQLRLALTWDRVDIAQEDIFREDCIWGPGSLDDILMDAILMERVEFVHLILQQGVVMKEFLTKGRLTQLYHKALSTKKADTVHLKRIAVRHGLHRNDENIKLRTVKLLMDKLMDKYDENFQDPPSNISQTDENKQCTYPYKEILIWSSLLLKQKMAKFAWEMGGEPVTSAVAASRIYGSMATYIHRNEQALKDRILLYKDEFEKLAVEVLDECHVKDHEKAMMLVERCSPTWSDMSSLSMAASAYDRAYLASVACQNSISITWKRGIVSPWQRVLVCMLVPFLLMTRYLEMSFMGEQGFNLRQKITTFFTAPITKFANHTLMYIAFLVLFTYMLLVDFEAYRVTPIECICVAWIFTFMVDDIYTLLTFPSPTFYGKLRDWYGFLKWLDLINFILAFIAFVIHFREDYFEVTKIMYCINGVILYIRILKTYTANANLGPKMVMIQRMMAELKMFVMVLLVFLLAYGISSQALLYKQRRPSWIILKDMFYFPYWQLFGEIFLDDLNTDEDCLQAARQINDTALAAAEELYCLQNHWLVYFLLAAYLMVGNVLLLNLLIAIFSHVFDTIEENSIEIWKYQMYFLTMEFDNKTAFVPPFSIFAHFYLTFKWIFRKTCCRKGTKGVQFSKRHLEYLQLFEKEEMTNLLRRKKARDKETIETKISLLQKRNEELFKVLEEDFFPELGGVEDHHKHYLETTFFNPQEVAKAPELVKEETKETIILAEQEEDEETKRKNKKKLKKQKKEKKKKEKEERLKLNNFDNPVFKHDVTPDKSIQFSPHLDVVSHDQPHVSPSSPVIRKSSLESPKRPGLYRRVSNRSYGGREIQDIDSSDEDIMRTSGHFGMRKSLNVPSGHFPLRRSLSRDSTDSEENNMRALSPRMFTRMARESSTEDERKKHKKKRKKLMKKMISDTE